MIDYSKLIGYSIDTNQVKSSGLIKSEQEAKNLLDKIIDIYTIEMFDVMYLFGHRFTSYVYGLEWHGKKTLSEFLNSK